jgi:RNA polymerase sigma-70 factor (ECF subfamily)
MTLLLAMAVHVLDAELVKRFKTGDSAAFTSIVERYQDRVYTQCLRWLGDKALAEEVAQDVFLALYRSLERFRGEARLSTWIYRVVVNHCKNKRLYRNRRHMVRHEPLEGTARGKDDDGPVRQIAAEGPGTDNETWRSEAETIVHEGLQRLDAEQRRIILLRDIQDLSYEQISDILDLPRGTVKSRLHRARGALASVLSERIKLEDVY